MGVFLRVSIILVTICLDIVLSGYFGMSLISPSATLMLVVAWALLLGFTESVGWVMLAGLMADLLLFRPLGFSVLIFVVASYGSSFLLKRFLVRHPLWILIPFLGVVLFSVGVEMIALLVFLGVGEGSALIVSWVTSGSFLKSGMLVLVNSILFFLSYRVLDSIETFLSYYKRRIQPKRYA